MNPTNQPANAGNMVPPNNNNNNGVPAAAAASPLVQMVQAAGYPADQERFFEQLRLDSALYHMTNMWAITVQGVTAAAAGVVPTVSTSTGVAPTSAAPTSTEVAPTSVAPTSES